MQTEHSAYDGRDEWQSDMVLGLSSLKIVGAGLVITDRLQSSQPENISTH